MKLLQQEISDEANDPWGVLVACILLNRAKYGPAKEAWDKMKKWYGTPKRMSQASAPLLEGTMKGLGLQTVRAKNLIEMSKGYLQSNWQMRKYYVGADASQLPGCGGFAKEAWNLIVVGDTKTPVVDHYLEEWRRWKLVN